MTERVSSGWFCIHTSIASSPSDQSSWVAWAMIWSATSRLKTQTVRSRMSEKW